VIKAASYLEDYAKETNRPEMLDELNAMSFSAVNSAIQMATRNNEAFQRRLGMAGAYMA